MSAAWSVLGQGQAPGAEGEWPWSGTGQLGSSSQEAPRPPGLKQDLEIRAWLEIDLISIWRERRREEKNLASVDAASPNGLWLSVFPCRHRRRYAIHVVNPSFNVFYFGEWGRWMYSSSLLREPLLLQAPTTNPSICWPLINMDHKVAFSQQRWINEKRHPKDNRVPL